MAQFARDAQARTRKVGLASGWLKEEKRERERERGRLEKSGAMPLKM